MKYLHSLIFSGGKCKEFKVNLNRTSIINVRLQLFWLFHLTTTTTTKLTQKLSSQNEIAFYFRSRIAFQEMDELWIDVNVISHTTELRAKEFN
jgi:hypothetical protein